MSKLDYNYLICYMILVCYFFISIFASEKEKVLYVTIVFTVRNARGGGILLSSLAKMLVLLLTD